MASTILVMGFFLSVILNGISSTWLLIRWFRKIPMEEISRFIIYVNGTFLVVQLIFLLK